MPVDRCPGHSLFAPFFRSESVVVVGRVSRGECEAACCALGTNGAQRRYRPLWLPQVDSTPGRLYTVLSFCLCLVPPSFLKVIRTKDFAILGVGMFALSRAPEDGQDVPNRSGITIQTYMNEPHRLIYTDKPNFSAHTLRLRVGRTQSSLACRMGAREGRAPDNQGNLAHLRHPRRLRRPTSRHVARHHLCVVHVSTRARNSAPTADRQRTP